MTNTVLLNKLISDSGLKKNKIADALGISYAGLKRKIDNVHPFKPNEIVKLCEILHITSLREREAIFFAPDVEENSTKE